MKNTNPFFNLRNFRSFGENGADFELAPITVLTGCNSAGKSSLVKAIMLLSRQLKEGTMKASSYDIDRYMPQTDLGINATELKLGQFSKVINDKSDKNAISFSYRIWSDFLQEEVVVKRTFVPKHNDLLNNGYLHSFTIEKKDGAQIYGFDALNEKEKENVSIIEENYIRYVRAVELMDKKKQYELIINLSPRNKEMIEELNKKGIDAYQELNKINIQVEHYSPRSLSEWPTSFNWDSIAETKLYKFLNEGLTQEEKEERNRRNFISLFVNEVIRPWFITQGIAYINSDSAQILRLYDAEDENKMCKALLTLNNRNINYQYYLEETIGYYKSHKPGSFMNKWIKKFGIGDGIEVKGADEGLGLMVYLNKGNERRLLADEGYGITQLISLLLQIDNHIPTFIEPTKDLVKKEYKYLPQTICVEEPEVHLHPKYQSLLAELFVEAYQKYNIRFIIETHSEYLIRKLQVMVADKENMLNSNDVSLNYVEKDENGVSTNRKIEIQEDGGLSGTFGSGFYDEADTLALDLFRKKTILL